MVANLGSFCSYCEVAVHDASSLAVEHIQPKSLPEYTDLETKWSNFLLACQTCNGKSNKGSRNVVLDQIHLPHRNNTFFSLKYAPGGVVMVNPMLQGISRLRAENLLNLVGLNKTPQNSGTDKRWLRRSEDWKYAEKKLKDYQAGRFAIDDIIEYVKARGGWSIWFTVFDNEDAVRERLIRDFPGTSVKCFDAANHYQPIERNPGQADPV
ncbi:MAG: HNH endonuclease [Lentisphaeria bacterium]|nr:HNH endonuclease [Lentisphaeria bacterium]